jgi:hypothetical protein
MAGRSQPWWRSRTLIANFLVLAVTAAESQLHMLQPVMPVDVYALLAFALPVMNALLRAITSAPLGAGRAVQPGA